MLPSSSQHPENQNHHEPAKTPATAAGAERASSTISRGVARLRALAHSGARLPPYMTLGRFFPGREETRGRLPDYFRGALALSEALFARPGYAAMLQKVEREDLFLLPFLVAATPFDLTRIRRKYLEAKRGEGRARAGGRRPVTPPDDFPYPDYYLNDFHNQKNGNLSLQSALTYELQIRVLFFGANRLMRQGVIEHVPPGEHLDVLDVACGNATWLGLARPQGRIGRALERLLRSKVLGQGLFNLLVSHPSLRSYLARTYRDASEVTPELVEHSYQTAHQPGARLAPAAFIGRALNVDLRAVLPQISTRSLVLWTEHNPFQDVAREREAFSRLAPQIPMMTLQRTGALPYDEDPAAFVALVEDFIAGPPGLPAPELLRADVLDDSALGINAGSAEK